jgi:2-dehydro-3-deoxyglucarate aldolase/4-hydroxy-2-oxoheptanedioate aldolase
MQINNVKSKLKAGEVVYGTSLEISLDPETPLLLASAGLDFFFVDTEHCPADYHEIQALCRTARGAGLIPLVRVTQNEPYLITRALDVGAMGIIIPRVHSREEACRAVQAAKYLPEGQRGFGMRSVIHDFRFTNPTDEMASANRETLLVLQIESREGLAHVEEIAAVPQVDALFIGPYDLTISMGIAERFESEGFWNAVQRVVTACDKAGIAAGIQSPRVDLLHEAMRRGVRFVLYSSDVAVLLAGFRAGLEEVKHGQSRAGSLGE